MDTQVEKNKEERRPREKERIAWKHRNIFYRQVLAAKTVGTNENIKLESQGLSNPSAIPNLRNLAQWYHPDTLFQSDTLAKAKKLEFVRVLLKFDSSLTIDVEGRNGGLVVLWKDKIKYNVMNFSRNFVNLSIQDELKGQWRLTCYYEYPGRERRSDYDLTDVSLEGHLFTWIKSRGTDCVVEERLDRALANSIWMTKFPNVRSKKATFSFIKDRIGKKINSWNGRSLSKAGKEVMIKLVLQAIPSYIMGVFVIPDAIVNDIEKMLISFWWRGSNNNKRIMWLAWDKLTCSKKECGIVLRDFKDFNMAMAVKQG
ncbi:hypothetical protein KIW84_032431 [Lathyrus oleraceus]|uniref:Reverse transcriptase n=1 Tax=Pisum sativum TaxID=3888 RepID=A0A9D4XT94_PEA|nr:hypothetical protein KIW84_032431 [Pisum sativum]